MVGKFDNSRPTQTYNYIWLRRCGAVGGPSFVVGGLAVKQEVLWRPESAETGGRAGDDNENMGVIFTRSRRKYPA